MHFFSSFISYSEISCKNQQQHCFRVFDLSNQLIWILIRWVKGQMISEGLFGVLEFSQKMNEQIRRSSRNEFVRSFFGRIRGYQKSFRNYLTFRNYHETNVCIFPLILKILIHPSQKCGKNNVVTCVWLPVLNSYWH